LCLALLSLLTVPVVCRILDNLPAAVPNPNGEKTTYKPGFPLGYVDETDAVYLNNHVDMRIFYHMDDYTDAGARIVRFEVNPSSYVAAPPFHTNLLTPVAPTFIHSFVRSFVRSFVVVTRNLTDLIDTTNCATVSIIRKRPAHSATLLNHCACHLLRMSNFRPKSLFRTASHGRYVTRQSQSHSQSQE
jgi:hypothetical protein